MDRFPTIAIVVLNWNDAPGTITGLDSVFRLDYPNYRVVVCDNGSSDDSLNQMKAWACGEHDVAPVKRNPALPEPALPLVRPIPYAEYGKGTEWPGQAGVLPKLSFMQVERNAGFTGGVNAVIQQLVDEPFDYVLLLNNDALVAPQALRHMVAVAETQDAAMVGAMIWSDDGKQILFGGQSWPLHLFGLRRKSGSVSGQPWLASYYAEGSAMLIRRDLLLQRIAETGYLMDPNLFMYCEDTDLCLYGLSRGYRCLIATEAAVYHGHSQSFGGAGNPNTYYYITRNRLLVARRWLSFPWNLVFHVYYVPSRVSLQMRRSLKRQPSRWQAVMQGVAHGYRNITGKWKPAG